jgi:hypothetical protein
MNTNIIIKNLKDNILQKRHINTITNKQVWIPIS